MPASHPRTKRAESESSTGLFAGKYRLLRLLGRGAMGEVWLAEEEGPRNFRRRVAVKRLAARPEIGEYARDSFFAEAQVIARLDHPNVVRLIELGTVDACVYLVLDYIDGPAIDRVLKRVGVFSPRAVAYIGREVARALEAVHSLCDDDGRSFAVVHRDVSPSNILIARDGRVRLTDFGVARISGFGDQQTEAGVFKGKLAYMPPEQARGEAFDGRADVFALGLTLLEALLGRRVRKAETQTQLIMSVAATPVTRARELLPELPAALAAALDAATEFDAAMRTADARTLATDLDRALQAMGDTAEQDARRELKERVEAFISISGPVSGSGSRQPPPLLVADGPGRSTPPPAGARSTPPSSVGRSTPPSSAGRSMPPSSAGRSMPPSSAGRSTPPPSSSLVAPPVAFLDFDGPEESGLRYGGLAAGTPEQELKRQTLHSQLAAGRSGEPAAAPTAPSSELSAGTDGDDWALSEERRRRRIFFTGLGVLGGLVLLRILIAVLSGASESSRVGAPDQEATTAAAGKATLPPASAEAPPPRESAGTSPPSAPSAASGHALDGGAAPGDMKQGALQVVALPWADVIVDGRSVGTTPIPPILLAPGQHKVTLRNAELGATRTLQVSVKAGAPTLLRVDLRRP